MRDGRTDPKVKSVGPFEASKSSETFVPPFPLGFHHMGRVLIPVSESFFKITGSGTLVFLGMPLSMLMAARGLLLTALKVEELGVLLCGISAVGRCCTFHCRCLESKENCASS